MRIISFAWTTPAVKVLEKIVTRREWDDNYAMRFNKGDFCQAYDKNPRIGGKPFGIIELTAKPYKEWSNLPHMDEWRNEGFEYLTNIGAQINGQTPAMIWLDWHQNPRYLWVVRFQVVNLSGEQGE